MADPDPDDRVRRAPRKITYGTDPFHSFVIVIGVLLIGGAGIVYLGGLLWECVSSYF